MHGLDAESWCGEDADQGSAVLTNALGQPELMARQARRLEKWIEAFNT